MCYNLITCCGIDGLKANQKQPKSKLSGSMGLMYWMHFYRHLKLELREKNKKQNILFNIGVLCNFMFQVAFSALRIWLMYEQLQVHLSKLMWYLNLSFSPSPFLSDCVFVIVIHPMTTCSHTHSSMLCIQISFRYPFFLTWYLSLLQCLCSVVYMSVQYQWYILQIKWN